MKIYICPRCGYSCNQKNDMRKHFNRKKICYHSLEDISINECIARVLGNKKNESPKNSDYASDMHPVLRKNGKKCIRYASDMHPANVCENTKNEETIEYTCEFCGEIFTKHQNYYRHKKTRCKKKDSYTVKELEIMVDERDKMIDELRSQIGALLDKVGSTTNNTTFNFVVNAFGNEDTSYIGDRFIKNLIKSGPYDSIPKLLQEIHFHPEHSENLNVKIPNKKLQVAQIFNGVKWEYKDKKETIKNMSDKAYGILNKHYDQTDDNIYMEQFKHKYESGDKETIKKIKETTELTILNNQVSHS